MAALKATRELKEMKSVGWLGALPSSAQRYLHALGASASTASALKRAKLGRLVARFTKQKRRVPIDNQPIYKAGFQQCLDSLQLFSSGAEKDYFPFEEVIQLNGERSLINITLCHFAVGVEELAQTIADSTRALEILKLHPG